MKNFDSSITEALLQEIPRPIHTLIAGYHSLIAYSVAELVELHVRGTNFRKYIMLVILFS
jgi:hypothetical protein